MNKRDSYICGAFLAGFLYRALISLQGIDHIDSGFSNTFFQNIFAHPETMTFYFNYYLSGLFGGLWYQQAPATGMLGFRFLEVSVLTASLFFVYQTFKRQFTHTGYVLVAILVSFLFPNIVTTLHYNTLTFFFLSLAAWLYAKSLHAKPSLWLFFTGMALGVCFFVRIVNLALGVLVLIPMAEAWQAGQRSDAVRRCVSMLAGMATSCAMMFTIMHFLGHLPHFLAGVSEAFGFFGGSETSHASGNLFLVYFKSYVNILLQMLALVVLAVLFLRASQTATRWSLLWKALLSVAAIVLVSTSLPYLSTLALCTLLCVYTLMTDTPRETKGALVFVMVAAYIFPFGSDIGIPGIFHWTAGLLVIPAVLGVQRVSATLRKAVLVCILCISVVMLWKTLSASYGEKTPRWQCTAQVPHSLLNTYTHPAKAAEYEHIISILRSQTNDNHWLVIGNQASELYYATEALPFLGNTQMGTFMGDVLFRRLDRQVEKFHQQPVIAFLNTEEFVFNEAKEMQAQLQQWMNRNHYKKTHDDEYLTIYQPSNQ